MRDEYASEEDTKALMTRKPLSPAERLLNEALEKRWANEQGVDIETKYRVLYEIAVRLIEAGMK